MKFLKIAVIILIIVGFASCKDAQEPETLGYVVAIGIDEAKEGEMGYSITLQFANPNNISGGSNESGGEGGRESIENITVSAPGIYPAINIANHIISKKFVLSHTKLIVFSNDVAKKGVGGFLEAINRNGDIRPNAYFAVSKGSAKDFLEAVNPKTEVNPVRYYTMIFENDYSGFIPQNMSREFFLFYKNDEKSTVMPLCSVAEGDSEKRYDKSGYQYEVENYIAGEMPTESGEIQVAGMAIFNGDKKVSEMNQIETEIFNILTGEYQSSIVTYYFGGERPVTVRQTQKKRPKVSIKTREAVPKIKITIYLEAEISASTGETMIENEISEFSSAAAKEIKRKALEFLEKTKEAGTDVVGFGGYAKRKFTDIQEFYQYDWKNRYKDAEFDLLVDFSVRGTGLIVRSE